VRLPHRRRQSAIDIHKLPLGKPAALMHNVRIPRKGGYMSLVAERPTRTSGPSIESPTSSRPWRVGLLSLISAALCGWVLLPLFVTAGLAIMALTMLTGAAAVAGFLAAVGPPSE
jgi:hypothetical protein